jgi:hypothetical protein
LLKMHAFSASYKTAGHGVSRRHRRFGVVLCDSVTWAPERLLFRQAKGL